MNIYLYVYLYINYQSAIRWASKGWQMSVRFGVRNRPEIAHVD